MVPLPIQERLRARPSEMDARLAAPALAGLAIYALVVFAPQVLNDGDTWWHLAAGRWMLDHGQVLRTDVFSYTFSGKPWVAHEWLSEVLMALAFRAAGWSGVVLLFGCAAAVAVAQVARRLAGHLPPLSIAAALVLMFAFMAPGILARPHFLVLPIVVAWMNALLAAREHDRAPPLAMAALMIVWANMHGGHILGLGLIAPFALEALLAAEPGRRLAVFRAWTCFGLAGLAASLVTPFGVAGLLLPFQLVGLSFLPEITEWRPQDFSKIGPFEIALISSLFVMLQRGVRVPAVRLLLLLGLLHMALHQSRHQFLLGPLAALLLAEPLGKALAPDAPKPHSSGFGWAAACAVAAGVLLAGVRLAAPVVRVDGPRSPIEALSHAPASLRAQPVFNDYGFGGYLIFEGVRPFIDGRSGDLYGEAFSSAFFHAVRPDEAALDALLQRWRVSWTLLSPSDPVTRIMDRRPGWRRFYSDRYAVIHVRDDVPPPP